MGADNGTNGSGTSGGAGGKGKHVAYFNSLGLFYWLRGTFIFYKVEPSERGVVTRFGAFYKMTEEEPHFKLPFGMTKFTKIPVTGFTNCSLVRKTGTAY